MKLPGKIFVLYEYDPEEIHTDDLAFTYMVGLKVENLDEVPKNMYAKVVPGAKYACFTHKGGRDTLGHSYDYIDGKWIPGSQYQWDNGIDFEVYAGNPNAKESKESKEPEIDLYISIK